MFQNFKIQNELVEKLQKNEIFVQSHFSLSAKGIYRNGHDGNRIMKWMASYDIPQQNMNCSDLKASIVLTFK